MKITRILYSLLLLFYGHLSFSQTSHLDGETKLVNPSGRTLLIERNDEDSWLTFHDPGQHWFSLGIDKSNSGSFSLNSGGTLTSSQFVMNSSGNIGIGTPSPENKLHIQGGPWSGLIIENPTTSGGRGIRNQYLDGNGDGWQMYFGGHYTGQPLRFRSISQGTVNSTSILSLLDNGRVGIGTDSPDSELTVAGNIHSREVKVTVNAGADFVFDESYQLRTLEETEKFISENRHLPEIASENEMLENGLQVGEMNIKLLQKIEELTLYMIEMNKRMSQLETENVKLKEKAQLLEN